VTIVCLGDSVTAGGNASKPEFRYVDVFAAGLRERFPNAKIDVQNLSAGGSNSRQWLDPEKHPYRDLHGLENPARFDRVVEAKPDLVTIEFVNDAGLNAAQVEESYGEILHRLEPIGAEVILITPHFTMWRMMGFKSMREAERRPYVLALREFASKHQLGLADASARWQHLAKEGLPYLTLLDNTINHPDDRGHRLFAEELWKCFQ
jgi:lysophospholipase L1-like esterase